MTEKRTTGRMPGRATTVLALMAALLAGWAYRDFLRPPPPRTCGSPGGPPVTSPRVRLGDGRYLAYREWGVPREAARHRVVLVHGFDDSKHFGPKASPELVEELGVYFVSFDRAGYGESDPSPNRTVASEAKDIQELADNLDLGERFYVIGASMGGYPTWSCVRYIPHRLAGVAMISPVTNYWWPSLPAKLSREAFGRHLPGDRHALWIAHHFPWLLYGYMTQKLVTPSEMVARNPELFSRQDKEILAMVAANPSPVENKARQQGVHESLHRDLMVGFGRWEFDPTELDDPFPGGEGSVHIWQGAEDRLISAKLQRHVAGRLPWVRYHECSECGHLMAYLEDWNNAILKALLLGEEPEQPSSSRKPS